MNRATLFIIVLVLLFSTTLVLADTFLHPPENNTTPGEWETSFPYQRNATIDFATDPSTWPDATDPGAPAGAKDLDPTVNYILEGTHDDGLWLSDWWYLDPGPVSVTWNAAKFDRSGILWLYNLGPGSVDVIMEWHFDNIYDTELVKNVWVEAIITHGDATADLDLIVDSGYEAGMPELRFSDDLPSVWGSDTWYAYVIPNPEWEILRWTIHIPAGRSFGIDEIHVATESVPEPGSIALFSLGLLGLGAKLRRRKES